MKTKTDLHAGQCPATWYMGTVTEASGGGYYGSITGDDGILRYFNSGYTSFCPSQGVYVGQRVLYAPITSGDRQGKVGCLQPSYCQTPYG